MGLITIVTVITGTRRCSTIEDMNEILTLKVDAVECIIEGDAFVTDCFGLALLRPRSFVL